MTNKKRKIEIEVLAQYHKTILEAMRSREYEIIKFLGVFGIPITGYLWFIINTCYTIHGIFGAATGTIIALTLGAWYVITLSYNFRYLQIIVVRAEGKLGAYNTTEPLCNAFKSVMFDEWSIEKLKEKKWKYFDIAPEMFKVILYLSLFLISCVFITFSSILFLQYDCNKTWMTISILITTFFISSIIIIFNTANSYCKKIEKLLKST